jgi:hypothetical protein
MEDDEFSLQRHVDTMQAIIMKDKYSAEVSAIVRDEVRR